MKINNLLQIADLDINKEIFETLLAEKEFTVERIISPFMPEGDAKWWNPKDSELVFLLQGKAILEFENKDFRKLSNGDYLFISKGMNHRVAFTSENPLAIWLAIHFKDNSK